jgi:hypothetical protein
LICSFASLRGLPGLGGPLGGSLGGSLGRSLGRSPGGSLGGSAHQAMADPGRFFASQNDQPIRAHAISAARPAIDLNGKASTATMKQISATNAPIEPIPSSDKSG